jgi:hypothetical protein
VKATASKSEANCVHPLINSTLIQDVLLPSPTLVTHQPIILSGKGCAKVSNVFKRVNFKYQGNDDISSLLLGRQQPTPHPKYTTIIDAGAFNGRDFTIPGFQRGLRVFSFEMSPENRHKVIGQMRAAGLVESRDCTIIRVSKNSAAQKMTLEPPMTAFDKIPHIYFFEAGLSNQFGWATASNRGGEMAGVGVPSNMQEVSAIPLLRLDDIVPINEQIFILKVYAYSAKWKRVFLIPFVG